MVKIHLFYRFLLFLSVNVALFSMFWWRPADREFDSLLIVRGRRGGWYVLGEVQGWVGWRKSWVVFCLKIWFREYCKAVTVGGRTCVLTGSTLQVSRQQQNVLCWVLHLNILRVVRGVSWLRSSVGTVTRRDLRGPPGQTSSQTCRTPGLGLSAELIRQGNPNPQGRQERHTECSAAESQLPGVLVAGDQVKVDK